jgi:hypothetical protein
MQKLLLQLGVLLVVSVLNFHPAQGQAPLDGKPPHVKAGRVIFTLALVPTGSLGADDIRIIRHTGLGRDIVAITPEALNVQRVSAAVFTLASLRWIAGDTPARQAVIRVKPAPRSAAWERSVTPLLERTLERLRQSPAREIHGFGRVRAYDLDMRPGGLSTTRLSSY